MEDFYTAFGRQAENGLPPIIVSGRHIFHADTVSAIVADIHDKLTPQADDRLLEIGCGVGLLLRPLAGMVAEAVGMDHPSILERFAAEGLPNHLTLCPGKFPQARPDGQFDRVLVYSVLHYLSSADEAHAFIQACMELVAPGGALLIADLPNADMERRFRASGEAADVTSRYVEARDADRRNHPGIYEARAQIERNVEQIYAGYINDRFLLDALARARGNGWESYVLPQPPELPFSRSREDLLFRRRP